MEDRLRQLSGGRRRRLGLTLMALYEYQCARCGRKTEVIQRFSDPAPKKCPHCGGALTKLLSSPAFQFKGSGFYSTDYGKAGSKPEDSSRGKEADGGATSDAGAGSKGASAGDSEKKDSSKGKKDSGSGAAKESASGGSSTAPPEKKPAKD